MKGKIKLIIIDDEEAVQFIFEDQFEKEILGQELELLYFSRGHALMSFLNEKELNPSEVIVVSDIKMPGLDGVSLSQFLSTKYPEMDVYLTSAQLYKEDDSRLKNAGIKGFIPKPIDFALLKNMIKTKKQSSQKGLL